MSPADLRVWVLTLGSAALCASAVNAEPAPAPIAIRSSAVRLAKPTQTSAPSEADLALVPNLTFSRGFSLPPKTVDFGGSLTLTDRDAIAQAGGRCTFSVSYAIKNQGARDAAAFAARFRAGEGPKAPQLAVSPDLAVAAGQTRSVLSQFPLTGAGPQTLRLNLDEANVVTELDEANNSGQVTLSVEGSCTSRVDMVSTTGLALGNGAPLVAWGQLIKLTEKDATSIGSDGVCSFPFRYELKNVGAEGSGPFTNRMRLSGKPAATQLDLSVGAGEQKTIEGTLRLPAGNGSSMILQLFVDDDWTQAESDKNNNARMLTVQVGGACK